MLVFELVN